MGAHTPPTHRFYTPRRVIRSSGKKKTMQKSYNIKGPSPCCSRIRKCTSKNRAQARTMKSIQTLLFPGENLIKPLCRYRAHLHRTQSPGQASKANIQRTLRLRGNYGYQVDRAGVDTETANTTHRSPDNEGIDVRTCPADCGAYLEKQHRGQEDEFRIELAAELAPFEKAEWD
jgi:hypothetical protein